MKWPPQSPDLNITVQRSNEITWRENEAYDSLNIKKNSAERGPILQCFRKSQDNLNKMVQVVLGKEGHIKLTFTLTSFCSKNKQNVFFILNHTYNIHKTKVSGNPRVCTVLYIP